MSSQEVFQNNVGYLREHLDFPTSEAPNIVGIGGSTLINVLNGHRSWLETVDKVANALGVEPQNLITEDYVKNNWHKFSNIGG